MPTTEELLQQILEELKGLREDMIELLADDEEEEEEIEEQEESAEEESAEDLDSKVNWGK